jgi:hypothetical protein
MKCGLWGSRISQQNIASDRVKTSQSPAELETITHCRGSLSSATMARTSARSAANRDQTSSPPKQSDDRQSNSPQGRRTRSTRSQSADLGESDIPASTKRGGNKGTRQVSVESIESITSPTSSRGGRTRHATRATAGPRGLNCDS